ncbi:MAG: LamB/YcsF family protein [Beutenbergiaceae bacterium]
MHIDLNADLGEGIGDDAAMLAVVTSANVACGGHAGDAESMRVVCRAAVANDVRIGAHLSYPDRDRFGRTEMDIEPAALSAALAVQLRELQDAARVAGGVVSYIKPHGALYHRVSWDHGHANAVVNLAAQYRLTVMGLPGSLVLELADAAGLPTLREAFADRAYASDGSLVPRGEDGAVLHDCLAIADRMVSLVRSGTVRAIDGRNVSVSADSICVHSDTPDAVTIARVLRAELTAAGVQIGAV